MLNATTVTFAGNLAAAPELRFTPNGRAVAEFRVIVNRRTKNEAQEWKTGNPPCTRARSGARPRRTSPIR